MIIFYCVTLANDCHTYLGTKATWRRCQRTPLLILWDALIFPSTQPLMTVFSTKYYQCLLHNFLFRFVFNYCKLFDALIGDNGVSVYIWTIIWCGSYIMWRWYIHFINCLGGFTGFYTIIIACAIHMQFFHSNFYFFFSLR